MVCLSFVKSFFFFYCDFLLVDGRLAGLLLLVLLVDVAGAFVGAEGFFDDLSSDSLGLRLRGNVIGLLILKAEMS